MESSIFFESSAVSDSLEILKGFSEYCWLTEGMAMKKTILFVLPLLFLLSIDTSFAVEATIFGPIQITRERGQPHFFRTDFLASKGKATLLIRNGDAKGDHRVRAAWGWINRKPVLRPPDLSHHSYEMKIPIRLNEENSILMYILGKPRDYLTFEIIQDMDWLSFQEGDPGPPGDNVLIDGIHVGDEWFDLRIPISLGQFPEGFTANLFFPTPAPFQELMVNPIFETLDIDDSDPCWFAFGAGLYFSGATTFNGVEGFFATLSPTVIQDWVLWANGLRQGCHLITDDLYITSFAIWDLNSGLPIPTLDAAIILPGQNVFP